MAWPTVGSSSREARSPRRLHGGASATTRSVSAHTGPRSRSMDAPLAPRSPVHCGGSPAPDLGRRREQARRDGLFARSLGLPRDGPGSRSWAGRGGESLRRARLRLAPPNRPTLARSSRHQSTGLCPGNPAGLRPDPDPLTAWRGLAGWRPLASLGGRGSVLAARHSWLGARCSWLGARCSALGARCSALGARRSLLGARGYAPPE
jgi:hypothetical protein